MIDEYPLVRSVDKLMALFTEDNELLIDNPNGIVGTPKAIVVARGTEYYYRDPNRHHIAMNAVTLAKARKLIVCVDRRYINGNLVAEIYLPQKFVK